MARNRKNQSAAVRFGPALKALVLCAIIGGSGVGYVWQKSQINELGRQITQRELRLKELDTQITALRERLAGLRTPEQLNHRVQEFNLGLALPQPNQVWSLPEPAATPSATVSAPGRALPASAEAGLAMH